jgi:eukaryotic-like serine/threonine-protein kinase
MSALWPEELPRGFEFDRYQVLDCVWRGSAASVYRAESVARGMVALKVFDRPKADRLPKFRQLSKNARAAAAVRHPNVAALLGVGVWRDHPYVVTEWLDGCDLEDYLDRWGVMSEEEVAELGLHLISGLMALHHVGAAHGDIKPSSVFLCNGLDGDVIPKLLLADLPYFNGHASPVDSTTREIAVSTPAYMAPEAIGGRGRGPSTDQYSLGAVLYECAVGQPPFVGDTLLELLKAVAVGRIEPPRLLRPELSTRLEEAILRAASPEPEARFESLQELGRALWPLASERAREPWAPAFGSGQGETRRKRRRPARAAQGSPAAASGSRSPARSAAKVSAALVLLAASVALSIGLGAFYFYALRGGTDTQSAPVESGPSVPAPELGVRF